LTSDAAISRPGGGVSRTITAPADSPPDSPGATGTGGQRGGERALRTSASLVTLCSTAQPARSLGTSWPRLELDGIAGAAREPLHATDGVVATAWRVIGT
jgi:hypothetical protein